MAKIVTSKEIQEGLGLKKIGFIGHLLAKGMMNLLKINDLNTVYDRHHHLPSKQFLDKLPSDLGADYEIHEDDLKRIPKEGAFITISNHPLGGLDGILLMKILTDARPEYKILANFLLYKIENLRPFLLKVNPFENLKDKKSSIEGIKKALLEIKEGNPIGIFPAGEVSMFDTKERIIKDREWQDSAIRLIKKANVPVVPVYFHARNSKIFYTLSNWSGLLRTAMLPRELAKKNKEKIKIRIGKPISAKEIQGFEDISSLSDFLRKKTYMLANIFTEEKKSTTKAQQSSNDCDKGIKKIISPISEDLLIKEIKKLHETDALLFEGIYYDAYFASSDQIPNILTEIGRLRELTFRDVGEGTNREIDLDKYDRYYHHLFLWDHKDKKIIGAYRMGLGKEIYEKYGTDGFYTSELFGFDEDVHFLFPRTIEMGRAFITKEYQQRPMPLFLLWKGIVHITLKYPEYRFLMGGVSISNQFSEFSKSVMIEFMRSHYYDASIAQYIHPKNEYKIKLKEEDKNFIFDTTEADLNKFDKLIDEIEPGDLRFPVLLKKYIKQNARIISFNVDPKFNDAIDGLMYIRIAEIPESTVKPIMEEIEQRAKEIPDTKKKNGSD
ncbi:MAG: GNAT family N-acyltransferase [Flavobacteriales bacterium]